MLVSIRYWSLRLEASRSSVPSWIRGSPKSETHGGRERGSLGENYKYNDSGRGCLCKAFADDLLEVKGEPTLFFKYFVIQ